MLFTAVMAASWVALRTLETVANIWLVFCMSRSISSSCRRSSPSFETPLEPLEPLEADPPEPPSMAASAAGRSSLAARWTGGAAGDGGRRGREGVAGRGVDGRRGPGRARRNHEGSQRLRAELGRQLVD